MIISNGKVFNNKKGFEEKKVFINGDKICDEASCVKSDLIDASNCYVIPGFVDVHFHGCMGCDFCDADIESIKKIAKYELKNGITSICPASMSLPVEQLENIFSVAAKYYNNQDEHIAELLGINMEGPFISLEKKGAQNPDYIVKPSIEILDNLYDKSKGLIKILDIAGEEDGAIEIAKKYGDKVTVSLAHTTCGYNQANEFFKNGAKQLTHTFNAMYSMASREPGPIVAAAENKDVMAEIIADGKHVHPAMVRVLFELFGDDRLIFVSDSMEACGMPDGEYELGGQKVYVSKNKASLKNGSIAGSVANLMDCFKTAVNEMNIPLFSAVKCASTNPAKSIGYGDKLGDIREGYQADLIILDKDLNIKHIIKKGKVEV